MREFREFARAAAARGFITQEVMISQRPAEAADRAVPGHLRTAVRGPKHELVSREA